MILYHGSNQRIENIDLTKSRPNKDFGRAFYLSDNYKQAYDMAAFRTELEGGDIVVNQYQADDNLMLSADLKVLTFTEYSEDWARFIFANRDASSGEMTHGYDIVYGPIANDRVGRQIANFKDGYISFETFLDRLKYMRGITYQYAFCTQQAIAKLTLL